MLQYYGTSSVYKGMRMVDPLPRFSYFTQQLKDSCPKLAYIHFVEASYEVARHLEVGSNDPFRKIWAPLTFVSAFHTLQSAQDTAENKGDIVTFGRCFLVNVCVVPYIL